MTYAPIESYGLIGDMHTAALVGRDGSIDWLCLPHFDSPSVFAAMLDDRKGGRFKVAPRSESATCRQLYWPETNVLVTRFFDDHGAAELIDFMPVGPDRNGRGHRVVRLLRVHRGEVDVGVRCEPAMDYGRVSHELAIRDGIARFSGPGCELALASSVPLRPEGAAAVAHVRLREGECATFVFGDVAGGLDAVALTEDEGDALFERTVAWWRAWLGQCTYDGRWRETVHRSALVLKLLTFEPTGAIVAAPTCSLPEHPGGPRNWDYRYTWIRDAAFTVYAFLRIGFVREAERFMHYLSDLCTGQGGEGGYLQVLYGVDGRRDLAEETLDHLEGYRGSTPVRVGNAAVLQLQLDIYGELLDAAYLVNKYGTPISYDVWRSLVRYVDWVAEHWEREDDGIWEVRNGPQHFVYSKLMCWVALDRAIRIARKRSLPGPIDRWRGVRDRIYRDILERGWSEERRAFVQAYGSDALDAAVLMMPLTLFMAPTDPRWLATLDALMRSPADGGLVSNSLVYRYDTRMSPDGLEGQEGTFNICTFWLVEALTRAGRFDRGRLDLARTVFERMLGFANPLGLYAEQTGHRGEALGNYPQAFTHLALISAAFNLDRALGGGV